MKGILLLLIFLLLLITPTQVFGHSGRTDSYGGHHKTANGTYHCHSGKCLEDAWKQAYDQFYPIGQQDGKKRNNHSEKVVQAVKDQLDPDIAEYMAPFAKRAYQLGYENTYVPTFWEKYGWYIGGTAILSLGILGLSRSRKKDL